MEELLLIIGDQQVQIRKLIFEVQRLQNENEKMKQTLKEKTEQVADM